MVQVVATLVSLLVGLAALGVIGVSLAEDWDALKRALGVHDPRHAMALPPRTRQLAPARRARIVRIMPSEARRAVA